MQGGRSIAAERCAGRSERHQSYDDRDGRQRSNPQPSHLVVKNRSANMASPSRLGVTLLRMRSCTTGRARTANRHLGAGQGRCKALRASIRAKPVYSFADRSPAVFHVQTGLAGRGARLPAKYRQLDMATNCRHNAGVLSIDQAFAAAFFVAGEQVMSMFSAFYPGDSIVAGAVVVGLAVLLTTTLALVVSRLLTHRPTRRHAVLASALVCSLAAPLSAFALRSVGVSTLTWIRPIATSTDEPSPIHANAGAAMVDSLDPPLAVPAFVEQRPALASIVPAPAVVADSRQSTMPMLSAATSALDPIERLSPLARGSSWRRWSGWQLPRACWRGSSTARFKSFVCGAPVGRGRPATTGV